MRWLILPFVLPALAACAASPAPEFIGAPSTTVLAGGRSYTIWQESNRFEIVRHGWAPPGEHQAIRATMLSLVEEVTGCTLLERSVTGDSGEMRGSLSCH